MKITEKKKGGKELSNMHTIFLMQPDRYSSDW
jgi:hypothetical protein